jgi:hypothetical protein
VLLRVFIFLCVYRCNYYGCRRHHQTCFKVANKTSCCNLGWQHITAATGFVIMSVPPPSNTSPRYRIAPTQTAQQTTQRHNQHNCDRDRVDDHHCNHVVKIDITMNTMNTRMHTDNTFNTTTPQNHNEIFYQLLS